MSEAPLVEPASGRRHGVRLVPPRSDRLQICVSSAEKQQLWEEARRAGAENLSDFARSRLLGQLKEAGD